jgi:hypothetical protein
LGYQDAGKLDLALPLYEETLRLTKAKLGADHPQTLGSTTWRWATRTPGSWTWPCRCMRRP